MRPCRLLVAALLSFALVVPAAAQAAWPAGDDAVATISAKKKKAKKKACKTGQVRKVKKVNGKRKKVCVKKKTAGPQKDIKTDPVKPNPPPLPPLPPPPPPPPPPPVDPEQYRADDIGRQAMAQGAFLERSTGGAFPQYTRVFLFPDGRLRITVVDWNVVMGEKCAGATDGTWSFNRAYKPPEGGLLLVLNIVSPTINGTETFWAVSDTVVRVGKDQTEYSINNHMADGC